jgi:FMN reductase [NAD(P)H]
MNATLDLLHGHRSVRGYTDAAVDPEALARIVEAGRRCPTSFNAQHLSLVVVRSAAARAEIARLAGGQPWIARAPVFIALVADANKTARAVRAAGGEQLAHKSTELLVACSIDAGIALGGMMMAARSLGLGVVPIGGIRRNPQGMIDLLGLPALCFPLCGMCIGHSAQDGPQKPRLPMATYRHDERYDPEALSGEAIAAYDRSLVEYWQALGRDDGASWSATLREHYTKNYFPDVLGVAHKQGFALDR